MQILLAVHLAFKIIQAAQAQGLLLEKSDFLTRSRSWRKSYECTRNGHDGEPIVLVGALAG
jgi:hypothetical protein